MIIYISGQMTGIKDYNIPKFNETERMLKKLFPSAVVINPARHPAGLDYDTYMEYTMIDIKVCDTVYQLSGWQKSKGARAEHKEAARLSKEIIQEVRQ